MKTTVPEYYHTHQLTHKYSGNGFMYVMTSPTRDTYCLVASNGMKKIEVARKDILSEFVIKSIDKETKQETVRRFPLTDEEKREIAELREGLETGKLIVKHWRAVPA